MGDSELAQDVQDDATEQQQVSSEDLALQAFASAEIDLANLSAEEKVEAAIRILLTMQDRMLSEVDHVREAIRILREGEGARDERTEDDDPEPRRAAAHREPGVGGRQQ